MRLLAAQCVFEGVHTLRDWSDIKRCCSAAGRETHGLERVVGKKQRITEAGWLACTEPQPMLEFLRKKVSDRKLRLFAVACCHQVWGSLRDRRLKTAVETSELFAHGSSS